MQAASLTAVVNQHRYNLQNHCVLGWFFFLCRCLFFDVSLFGLNMMGFVFLLLTSSTFIYHKGECGEWLRTQGIIQRRLLKERKMREEVCVCQLTLTTLSRRNWFTVDRKVLFIEMFYCGVNFSDS